MSEAGTTGSWVRLAYEAHLAEAAARKADRAYTLSVKDGNVDPGLRRAAQVARAQAARLHARAEQAIKAAAKD